MSRRWWGGWVRRISIAVVFGLAAQVLAVAPVFDSVSRWVGLPNVVPAVAQGSNPAPSPSGAEPVFPANPGFDPAVAPTLSALANADFEAPEASLGFDNANSTFDAPVDGSSFTNGDFETGDLSGWTTLVGSPVVELQASNWVVALTEDELRSGPV